MPQESNLNVSPYFDDFDASKNFYKVLFNPGVPIQARELTTLQSILQNQTEQFGRHIFKEGSVVIPGQLRYDNPVEAVELKESYNGIPISLYFNELLGKKVKGSISGVVGEIFYVLSASESERGNYTIYLRYIESGGVDFTNKTFVSGETLTLETSLTYGNYTIPVGQGVCDTISTNARSEGSSVVVANGVYFVRGFFCRVSEQRILLDQYGNTPSYRVGFNVIESIVSAGEDNSLFDNAQGYSNYAAPGADRFKIELELAKKSITDFDTDNFVEIMRVEGGHPTFFDKNAQYNLIRDELARRTYDESGNYFVKPFSFAVRDSLNDRILSNGIYFNGQSTVNGNSPSEDLMVYQIGPGKAYVNGYDVETISARLLDVPKTRTTKTVSNQAINFNGGNLFILNNGYGSPAVGLGTTATLSLMDSRIGASAHVATGTTIGVARVFDFIPESDYVDDTSRLHLRLIDVQTYTKITLSKSITLSTPAHILGKKSQSSGYLVSNVSSATELTLYNVSGTFLDNEQIIINGVDDGRIITSSTDYNISDIKSVYGKTGISTFNADLVLGRKSYIAKPGTTFQVTLGVGNISTITSGLENTFTNIVRVGDIVTYPSSTYSGDPIYNKVSSVSADGTSFTVTGVTTVTGICNGTLPTSTRNVQNIIKLAPSVPFRSSLLTRLDANNIVSLSVEEGEVIQRRLYSNISVTANSLSITIDSSDVDIYFESFDEDRFVITYSDGTIEPMRRDKYNLSANGKVLTFYGLSKTTGTADVITTVKNLKPNSKTKKLNKTGNLVVNRSIVASSGIGTTTLNDGLTYSNVYGTRVQDQEICLNVPDVVRVLAVYESTSSTDPSLPSLQLTAFSGPTNNNQDFIVGEYIVGSSSGAAALVVTRLDTDKLEYVYLNSFKFSASEIIRGVDSSTQAVIVAINPGSKNITRNFMLDTGSRDTFYDYGRLIRKRNVTAPSGKLRIIYQNYTIDASDTGEFISANSYSAENYKHDVTLYNGQRLTDFIDIRPRVAVYNTSSTLSPFEFKARNFAQDGQYSKYILAPDETIVASMTYYVGRIDRIFLNQDGTFEVSQGIPSDNPVPPQMKANALDVATVYIPPFVYNLPSIGVDMSIHKRYRMADIAILEKRIERVERYTTLSMLESKTENFQIRDAETGLDRFKCGFFVDNFHNHDFHDIQNSQFRACIDPTTNTLRPTHYTTSVDLQIGSEVIDGVSTVYNPDADHSFVTNFGTTAIRKTGDLITLAYDETLYYEQPFASKTESVTPFIIKFWTGWIVLHPPIDNWIEEREIIKHTTNETTTTTVLPDENITITENVVVDGPVATRPPRPRTGLGNRMWVISVQSGDNRVVVGGGVRTNGSGQGRFFGGVLVESPPNRVAVGSGVNELAAFQPPTGTTVTSRRGVNIERGDNRVFAGRETSTRTVDNTTQEFTTAVDVASGNNRVWIGSVRTVQNDQIPEEVDTTTSTTTTSSTTSTIIPREVIVEENVEERINNWSEIIRFVRSRNVEFDVYGLKPVTRFWSFLEGIDVNEYITPKLLEVQMESGRFQVGETVTVDPHFTGGDIRFRLCTPNHKVGPHNNPTETYKLIPYTQTAPPSDYSESSTYLNVDTRALQLPSETEYYGLVKRNMRLIGQTSGAVAVVKSNIRLVSDNGGRLIGSLFIPDPAVQGNPQWINGENTFTVVDVASLDLINERQEFISNTRVSESAAEAEYASGGIANNTEINIITTRNITIIPERRRNVTTITNTTTNTPTPRQPTRPNWESRDPLAQSFYVQDDTGIFITSVDVYFETKDETLPVTLQLRPMIAGVPSNIVIPFSEVTLIPDDVNVSIDGSVPTRFTLPSPVYLPGPQSLNVRQAPIGSQQTSEFAIVLQSGSPSYRVFIAELGGTDIGTGVKISQQPTLGSLFKSQNGTTWTPAQVEDLKYRINRAVFVNEGLLRFYNPKLDLNSQLTTVTGPNQFVPLAKKVLIGIAETSGYSANVVPGVDIVQGTATGVLIGVAGSITVGTGVTVVNAGTGYTNGTFTNIALETETGYGQGAVASVVVTGNTINSVTITSAGFGYQVGDSLLVPELGQNVGFGGKVVVSTIASNNAFVLDNVQGTFNVGLTTLRYITSAGITTIVGAGVTIKSITEDQYFDGRHMKVYHANHMMHSPENYVQINQFRPLASEVSTTLSANVTAAEATSVSVASTTGFGQFEGVTVSAANPGYVIIGNEVIKYTTVGGGKLSGITRGPSVDGSQAQSYVIGNPVYKYEFNGISIRRINKIHNFAEVSAKHPIDLNSYHIKIDTNSTDYAGVGIGSARPDLYWTQSIQTGKSGTVLTNNIQYEMLIPNVANIVPAKTDLTTRLRSFSGTSVSGDEKSFEDQGFIDISLTEPTYFASPRLLCSRVNEERFITNSPGNRSLAMEFLLETSDNRVSPVIDTIQVSTILTSNLVNAPLGIGEDSTYADDDTVRSIEKDKHAAIYISKPVRLKLPANSLKVLLTASRSIPNDVRVLYQLFRDDAPDASQNFELFPGYANYEVDGAGIKRIVDASRNDGTADSKITQSSDRSFKDYEYSVDDLPDFNGFAIKIVMASENQAQPPVLKDLRAIATVKPTV
jgi:hypothetical protein